MKTECIGCPHLIVTKEEGATYRECQFGAGIHEGSKSCVRDITPKQANV